MALAHKVGDMTEQAYRRSDALEKRQVLMNLWAAYVSGPPADAKVITLGAPDGDVFEMSAPSPPSWLADPLAWPPKPPPPPYQIERVRVFIAEHRVKLKWLWYGLIKYPPNGRYFGLKPCATEAEAHEKAFAVLIVAALYYADNKTRIGRTGFIGPNWSGFIAGVERVNARDKEEARAFAKGCLSKMLAQTKVFYGTPRRKVAMTLTKLATGYEVTPDMARALAAGRTRPVSTTNSIDISSRCSAIPTAPGPGTSRCATAQTM